MKIQYLGTAAAEGWPALFCRCEYCRKARLIGGKNIRTRSQAFIDQTLLLDFPADSYHHFLAHSLPFDEVDHIIITHSHADHFYPDDLFCRREPFAMGVENTLNIYGNEKVENRYWHAFRSNGCEENDKTLRFTRLRAFEATEIAGYQVTPLPANHDKTEECFIYLINDGKKTLLYGNDTGIFLEETWEAIRGTHIDLVSLDCTFMLEAEGSNHMGLPDNLVVKERLIEIGCADEETVFIANHFSHGGHCLHDEMEREARAVGFLVSYDGLSLEI